MASGRVVGRSRGAVAVGSLPRAGSRRYGHRSARALFPGEGPVRIPHDTIFAHRGAARKRYRPGLDERTT